jgi:hypothetical protein
MPQPAATSRRARVARAVGLLLARVEQSAERDASLAGNVQAHVEVIRDGIASVVLRAAAATTLPREGRSPSRPPRADELAEQIAESDRWSRRAGLRSPALTGATTWPAAAPEALRQWLDEEAVEALLDAVAPAPEESARPDLGPIHEALLELGILRLDGVAVCVGPNDTWVSVRALLDEPPETRSAWLQRAADLPKSAVQRLAEPLARARDAADVTRALVRGKKHGAKVAPAGRLVVDASAARRRAGAHYTPEALTSAVIARALSPLVEGKPSDALLALRLCDPAMGSGAFLADAARFLSDRVAQAWHDEGRTGPGATRDAALRAVVTRCLYGVDADPVAVDLARWSLARLAWSGSDEPVDLSPYLRAGNSLVGQVRRDARAVLAGPAPGAAFDWFEAFPDVIDARRGEPGGFDACLGNPPWVAYVGRAAQPLAKPLARYYEETNPAFHGYRTLHGLFVRRAAELLRPGGRLGLVVPTSVADLEGYGPTRLAHDALCEVDPELLDFGNGAFDGVFQPCMALVSTRRDGPATPSTRSAPPNPKIWPLSRTDLDARATRLLERLSGLPRLDAALFGERGFQSTGHDVARLRRLERAEPPFTTAIREGTDVLEFAALAPRTFVDTSGLEGRLRPTSDWQKVRVLIRQTARYPIAALSDGAAFRNSVLAGFDSDEWTAHGLCAYLNSSFVRWVHYTTHRDARQGMPQLKIGHLRSLPAVRDAAARQALDALGRELATRNSGITREERASLDDAVFDAFGLDDADRAAIRTFTDANPPPRPRER